MKKIMVLGLMVFSFVSIAGDKCKVGIRSSWGGLLDDAYADKKDVSKELWDSRQEALRLIQQYTDIEFATPRSAGFGRGVFSDIDFELISSNEVSSDKYQSRSMNFSVREINYRFDKYPDQKQMPDDFYSLKPTISYKNNVILVSDKNPWQSGLAELKEMLLFASEVCEQRKIQEKGIFFNVSGCLTLDENGQVLPEFAKCYSSSPASDTEKALAFCKSKKFSSVISFKVNRENNFSEIRCSSTSSEVNTPPSAISEIMESKERPSAAPERTSSGVGATEQ